jgi:methionine-rich copper-binding protein CopC
MSVHPHSRYAGLPSTMMALPFLLLMTPAAGTPYRDTSAPSHLHLLKSTPAADASLAKSPQEIRLVFSGRVNLATIDLRNAKGQRVAVSKAKLSVSPREVVGQGKDSVARNAGIVVASIPQPLKTGVYELNWKAAGSDGHAVHDHFAFAVGQAMPAHAPAAAGAAHSSASHDHSGTGKTPGR